jgi:hypothetical protein
VTRQDFEVWFDAGSSREPDGLYTHLRLRARDAQRWAEVRPAVIAYFERAHADARDYFHEALGVSLDPRGGDHVIDYPSSLPLGTKKGYFGEVFCGMLAEAEQVAGGEDWEVPIFLFRLHHAAEEYLTRLITGEAVAVDMPGRTGSDCLALALAQDGSIEAILSAESKCHETFNITIAKQAIAALGTQAGVPVSLPQLKRLLAELDAERYKPTILALERLITVARQPTVPRRDLIVFIFEDPAVHDYAAPRITVADIQGHYRCNCDRRLQVVEVHLPGAGALIEQLYDGLYRGGEAVDANN